MHQRSFVGLALDSFGCVNVPDMIRMGEVQQSGFGGDGGHKTPAASNREMQTALLAFEAANQLMDSVERPFRAHFVYNVGEWLVIKVQNLRT